MCANGGVEAAVTCNVVQPRIYHVLMLSVLGSLDMFPCFITWDPSTKTQAADVAVTVCSIRCIAPLIVFTRTCFVCHDSFSHDVNLRCTQYSCVCRYFGLVCVSRGISRKIFARYFWEIKTLVDR